MNSDLAPATQGMSRAQQALLALLVAYPSVLVAVAMANGPGISNDSVSYAAAATSWADAARLLTYDGTALTLFPPGLPLVMGTVMMTGVSLGMAAGVINVIATGLTIVAAFWLARMTLGSTSWALGSAAIVAVATSTVRVNSYLWTEPIFTLATLGMLTLLVRGARAGSFHWPSVVGIGVLISFATTFRFVGVIFVPLAVVIVIWKAGHQRWSKSVVVGAVGLVGLGASMVRNASLGAPMMGDRYPGSVGLEGAIAGLVRLWGEYVAPSPTTSLTVLAGAIIAVLLVVGAWLVVTRRDAAGFVLALFLLTYWVAIMLSQVRTRLDVATERFGAPALVPTIIIVLIAIRELMFAMSRRVGEGGFARESQAKTVIRVIFGAVAGIVLVVSVLHAVRFTTDGYSNGLGLNSRAALDRDLSRVAETIPSPTVVASNDPWQVWWVRQDGIVLDFPPSRSEWPDARVDKDLARLLDAVDREGSVTVLIDSGARASIAVEDLDDVGIAAGPQDTAGMVTVVELTPAD